MTRRQRWQRLDRKKANYRVKSKPVFMKAFDDQIKPLFDKIKETSDIRDITVPPLNDKPIEEAYKRLYLITASDYAMEQRREFRKKDVSEDEVFNALMYDEIINYLKVNRGATITAAGDTSVELIQRMIDKMVPEILDQGIGGGAAQTMLRDQIGSAWHEMKRFRTERIARTEVNRASNWGSLQGAKSVGIEQIKVWLSAFSMDSRPEHNAADGQRRELNEPFTVGGEDLMYPGDPNGSAGNTINCLCGIYYEIK